MVKYPEPGSVKTRLAEEIGEEKAANFYAESLAWILLRLHESNIKTVIFFKPSEKEDEFKQRYNLPSSHEWVSQTDGDLGMKMHQALNYLNDEYPGPSILIGSDSPDLPLNRIETAGAKLQDHDLVLGPARDGGYYLIGVSGKPPKILFENMKWSHSNVLADTLERAEQAELSIHLLSEWNDIDTLDDLTNKV